MPLFPEAFSLTGSFLSHYTESRMKDLIKKFIFLLAAVLLLTGCAPKAAAPDPVSGRLPGEKSIGFFAMDTYMSVRAFGTEDSVLTSLRETAEALEAELSVTREDSAVARLNREGTAEFSPRGAALLERTLELCRETGGVLDLSIYPAVRAWGFTLEDSYRVPSEEELQEILTHVDYRKVRLEGSRAVLPEGMEIDLGSTAKGYTGDLLCGILREHGVTSALLDLGGNVQALGSKPDGSPWQIAVRDPKGDGILGVLSIADAAVITSGGYERYFTDENGNLWWHIIDPADGKPSRSGLISATITGPEGVRCDGLSTAMFILGPEGAADFWRQHQDFSMVLVTEDGRLLVTEDLADRFRQESGSPYRMELLKAGRPEEASGKEARP